MKISVIAAAAFCLLVSAGARADDNTNAAPSVIVPPSAVVQPSAKPQGLLNLGEAGGVITPAIQGVPKIFLPDFGIAGDFGFERNSLPKTDPRFDRSLEQPRIRDGQIVAFSPIDPYTNAQFTIDLPENGQANIEEAWLYFTKLPAGMAVRVGRFLPQFGLLDQMNTFQLATYNRPNAIADYIGSDGLNATGAEVNFYVPNPWDLNLKADFNAARGDMLGATQSTSDLAYFGTLDYSQDLFTTGSLQLGASAAHAPSPFGGQETLEDPYVQVIYAPSQRRVWTWSAEGMIAQRQGLGGQDNTRGFYTYLDYNFALRYHVGFLVDVAALPGQLPTVTYPGAFPDAYNGAPASGTQVNLAPNFTWFVSDNTRLRVQYTHSTPTGTQRPDESVALQATFSLGNLKQME